jgi:predicted transcriptional regulator
MITVKELINRLQKENQDAIVLIDEYEYDMGYLRLSNIIRGKFNLPKGNDVDTYGGLIVVNKEGKFDFLKFSRNT